MRTKQTAKKSTGGTAKRVRLSLPEDNEGELNKRVRLASNEARQSSVVSTLPLVHLY